MIITNRNDLVKFIKDFERPEYMQKDLWLKNRAIIKIEGMVTFLLEIQKVPWVRDRWSRISHWEPNMANCIAYMANGSYTMGTSIELEELIEEDL